jgi:hypothetical protein
MGAPPRGPALFAAIPRVRAPQKRDAMATATLEGAIADLQAHVAKQGDVVRSLKAHAKDGKAEKVRAGGAGARAATGGGARRGTPAFPRPIASPAAAGGRGRRDREAAGA